MCQNHIIMWIVFSNRSTCFASHPFFFDFLNSNICFCSRPKARMLYQRLFILSCSNSESFSIWIYRDLFLTKKIHYPSGSIWKGRQCLDRALVLEGDEFNNDTLSNTDACFFHIHSTSKAITKMCGSVWQIVAIKFISL